MNQLWILWFHQLMEMILYTIWRLVLQSPNSNRFHLLDHFMNNTVMQDMILRNRNQMHHWCIIILTIKLNVPKYSIPLLLCKRLLASTFCWDRISQKYLSRTLKFWGSLVTNKESTAAKPRPYPIRCFIITNLDP